MTSPQDPKWLLPERVQPACFCWQTSTNSSQLGSPSPKTQAAVRWGPLPLGQLPGRGGGGRRAGGAGARADHSQTHGSAIPQARAAFSLSGAHRPRPAQVGLPAGRSPSGPATCPRKPVTRPRQAGPAGGHAPARPAARDPGPAGRHLP